MSPFAPRRDALFPPPLLAALDREFVLAQNIWPASVTVRLLTSTDAFGRIAYGLACAIASAEGPDRN